MKIDEKRRFVEDWKATSGAMNRILGDSDLDAMWDFARRKSGLYEGLTKYCLNFDTSALARVTMRAKMRALLEVPAAAPKRLEKLPSAKMVATIRVPQYIGTGSRSTGSVMVPLTDGNGAVTESGSSLMLAQALQQIRGHESRFSAFLPANALKALQSYVRKLEAAQSIQRAA